MYGKLAINFAGLNLNTPVIVSAGDHTTRLSQLEKAEKYGAGAVCTKLTFLKRPFESLPRYYIDRALGIIGPSGNRLEVKEAEKLIRAARRRLKIKIIANMMGLSSDLDEWIKLAKALEAAGAHMLELNLSCPNLGSMIKQVENATLGRAFLLGQVPSLAKEVTKAVKEAVDIPVMPKMTPHAMDVAAVARACEEAGADAISGINSPQGAPPVNIYNDGKPLYVGLSGASFGGVSGPWIRPLAYRIVAQMAQAVKVPIAGGGGLITWRHAVEMIMYGATAATFCTAIMLYGYEVLREIVEGLLKYMSHMGYESIEDFRGLALKHIVPPHKIVYHQVLPVVDESKCSGCGLCAKIGHCEVFAVEAGKAKVLHVEDCLGCGACYMLCPTGAISCQQV